MTKRILSLLAALCIALGCLAGCSGNQDGAGSGETTAAVEESIDYAGTTALDMNSETAKCEISVDKIKRRNSRISDARISF